MFRWFRWKTPTIKKVVEINHKSGDVIKITIEGYALDNVMFMEKRIKGLFQSSGKHQEDHFGNCFDEMNKAFEQLHKSLDKGFNPYGDK